jgi:hypothetical protein
MIIFQVLLMADDSLKILKDSDDPIYADLLKIYSHEALRGGSI